jgi:hypothetical protein
MTLLWSDRPAPKIATGTNASAAVADVADAVRDGGLWGIRATGERCGMVIDRAAATGLPRCDERLRVAAAAADEQPG